MKKEGIVSKEKDIDFKLSGFTAEVKSEIWVDNKLYPVLTARYEDLQSDAIVILLNESLISLIKFLNRMKNLMKK